MTALVLTVLGDDRPGLVAAIAGVVSEHGGSWERSELAHLAGKFAGIVVVSVDARRYDVLAADLRGLQSQGLQVVLERADAAPEPETRRLDLELLGNDHPGIVAEISSSVASLGVSIEELRTDVREAPMAGGTLFEARAVLLAPPRVAVEDLRAMLEGLAGELMVDVVLTDA